MKLSSVNNARIPNYSRNKNSNNNGCKHQKNNPSFGNMSAIANIGDKLAGFWQFVDNGGRALQFTVEDCMGTNIPRSIQGAMAGYKYTGKINIPAFLQEAVREFLTGPTMCVAPVGILAVATRLCGKTANTHVENIQNLSYLMQKVRSGMKEKSFYKTFFDISAEDMLKESIGKDVVDKADIDVISKGIMKYHGAKNKKEASKILTELQDKFEEIVKRTKDDFKNTDFTKVKYSVSSNAKGKTGFKNYIGYVSEYAKDFAKRNGKNGSVDVNSDIITAFKNNFIGKRLVTVSSMIVLTGILMSFIPKLYTLASGKVNPNASVIYDEAGKNKNSGNGGGN